MICGSCKNNVEDGAGYSFCPHCGKTLGAITPSHEPLAQGPSLNAPQPYAGQSAQRPYPTPPSPLPAPLQSALILRPGEALLRLMKATYIGDPRNQGGGEDDNDMSYGGVLIITDQRLALAVLTGLMNKRWSVHKNIELVDVKGTEVRTGFRKNYLCIYTTSNRVTYTEAWKEFYEIDVNTLKGNRPVDLAFAQQVINDALGRRRSGMR